MKILVLQHEQRRHFSAEPGHLEISLPLSTIATVVEYPYQRYASSRGVLLGDAGGQRVDRLGWVRSSLAKLLDPTDRPSNSVWRTQSGSVVSDNIVALNYPRNDTLFEDLRATVDVYRPDVILNLMTWWNESLTASVVSNIKNWTNALFVTVSFDYDYGNKDLVDYETQIATVSDVFVVVDSPERARRIAGRTPPYDRITGDSRAVFAPCPVDPRIFFPAPSTAPTVGLFGSSEGNRARIFDSLMKSGLPCLRGGGLLPGDTFLSRDEYARLMRESLISVCTQTQPERTQIKARTLQIIYSGSFLVEERTPLAEEFFEGIDVEFFSGEDELIGKCERLLLNPSETRTRAMAARDAVSAKYNPHQFIRTIMAA
jgi:hypothetical protein